MDGRNKSGHDACWVPSKRIKLEIDTRRQWPSRWQSYERRHVSAANNADSRGQDAADVVAFLSAATRLLFSNGETTRRLILAVERLGKALGVEVAYRRAGAR